MTHAGSYEVSQKQAFKTNTEWQHTAPILADTTSRVPQGPTALLGPIVIKDVSIN
jgi:hypothetical protein